MKNKREIGFKFEDIVREFLERENFLFVENNYYTKYGEIDLIFLEKSTKTLAFIEVKYRKDESFGYPLESVGYFKQQKIRKLARYYLNEKHYFMHSIRFDCIGIMGEKIDWIKGAFY